ncbi:MAG: hypothetical protein IT287_06575 [Bdellovibrionaceae bacterium]|nr:hypothetical protein [Pseudobdellovibrionaceae bacterium]
MTLQIIMLLLVVSLIPVHKAEAQDSATDIPWWSNEKPLIVTVVAAPSYVKRENVLVETNIACARQDGLTSASSELPGQLQTVVASPYNNNTKEEERAHSFDRATKLAMNYIYIQTLSSKKAKNKVADVLKKYNCNSSIPEQINYSEWIGKNVSFGSVTNSAIYSPSSTEKENVPSPEKKRWQDLGFTRECAQTRVKLAGICSGDLTPRMLMDELQRRQTDPKDSTSAGFMSFVEDLLKPEFLYNVFRDIKEDRSRIDVANKMDENTQLANENNNLRNLNIKLQKDLENQSVMIYNKDVGTDQEQLNKIAQLEKQAIELQNRNLDTIEKNNTKIRDNTLKIQSQISYQYNPPNQNNSTQTQTKEIYNPENKETITPLVDKEAAYAHFTATTWKQIQIELVKDANSCYKLPPNIDSSVWSGSLNSSSLVSGETCNYEMALNELKQLVPDQILTNADINSSATIDERIQNAMMNMPYCDINLSCSPDVMNEYYKSQGFDGGEAEFCAVTNTSCEIGITYQSEESSL